MTLATTVSAIAVAEAAGGELRPTTEPGKFTLRCLLHDDRQASAFVRDRVYHCSLCGTFRPYELAERLEVTTEELASAPPRVPQREPPRDLPIERMVVRTTWEKCLARARQDEPGAEDMGVYDWLNRRGLLPSWEDSMFGLAMPGVLLPERIAWWPRAGYRLVAPLYDADGEVGSIAARALGSETRPKVRYLPGVPVRGLAFVSPAGLRLLRGDDVREDVILGEGLTDTLALSIVAGDVPVLSAPGAGLAARTVGPWADGRRVIIALDQDDAGEKGAREAAEAVRREGGEPVRLRLPRSGDMNDALLALGIETLETRIGALTGGTA